jgi:Mce-associated membrane protein
VEADRASAVEDSAVEDSARATARTVPLRVLAAAAAVALVLVVLAAYSWTRADPKAIESGADTARAAAERAVVPVLSYDYRTLADGQKEAESQLTTRYRDKAFRPLFATIKENAPSTRTVVTTKVVESAVVRAGEDRVEVLLLVDRPTTNKKQTTPVTYEDHVTVTMAKADGGWLIDDMST